MKRIKNIIVPTDFSPTSSNAFSYARKLAELLDATITVVHVNEYILPTSELVNTPISEIEVNRLTRESMQMFIGEAESDNDEQVMVRTAVKSKILKGDVVDELVTLTEFYGMDLIVMGTTGIQDFFTKIVGSTSYQVANKAHCPVILVPSKAAWQPMEALMFASNYDSTTPKMVEEVIDFAQAFNAKVHFVNVRDFYSDIKDEVAEISWDELFPVSKPGYAFEVHTIYGQDTITALQQFAEKNRINLMAFVSKHRSFWGKLMQKSVTEKIALSTNIPMMVVHLDDNSEG